MRRKVAAGGRAHRHPQLWLLCKREQFLVQALGAVRLRQRRRHGELDRITGHDRLSAENHRCVLTDNWPAIDQNDGGPLKRCGRPHSANPTKTHFRVLNEEIAALLLAAVATSKFSFIQNMAKGQMSDIVQ